MTDAATDADSRPPRKGPDAVRLVATDLDGTLLGDDGLVSARTVAALRQVHAAGIAVVAATGRSHRTAAGKLAPAGVFDWSVCSNGAVLYDLTASAVVDARLIPGGQIPMVARSAKAAFPEVGFAWETMDGFTYDAAFEAARANAELMRRPERRSGVLGAEDVDVIKVLVVHPTMSGYDLLVALAPHIPDSVTVSGSGAEFVEITAAGVDKASALQRLCDRLGVHATEVVAFGDQHNDLSMLAWAGRGVAMGNAHPDVRAAASETTGTNADDGVAQVLDTLL